ncbi:zinc finger and BTB domain-containing protein 18.3-like, partial [Saccostrea cucullata]|uniref:zinc finger and BTB domain-containing protein 18.3-like n=1 Tax=Saccostrea cuccullata TaxID=36930 RepID=UPI002ED04A77
MSYQKFYTNPIHSSSLLCQLASMWKNDIMCDAVIRAGTVNTKAHRVVMMAACPMLQSMEHAASGSQLEIRLSPDIKQQSVLSFLQYLYEGFIMITEDNYRDIEKIGRLLQVDSVIKCCADFCKSLVDQVGTLSSRDQYRYSFCDMIEFRHVRTSELHRTMPDTQVKRSHDLSHDSYVKKTKRRHNSSQMTTTTSNYGNISDQSKSLQGGDVLQDSLELVQTEPGDRGGSCLSVGVGVVSHSEPNKETSVVTPTEECCDSATTCTQPSVTLYSSSVHSRTPVSSSAKTPATSTATPNSNEETPPPDISERTLVRASDQESESCGPNKYTGLKSQRSESGNQLGLDLSIVKVESGTVDQERHQLLEQEQVASEYRDTGQPQRSKSSEIMDTGQQLNTRRSSVESAQRKLDSDTSQNFRCNSGIQRHSDN